MKNKPDINLLNNVEKIDNRHLCLLSNDYLNKLKSLNFDTFVNKLFFKFDTVHNSFINNYANWVVSEYSYKHEFKKIKGLLDDLSVLKYNLWEEKIKNIFPRRTKEYKDIFLGVIKPHLDGNPSEIFNNLKLLVLYIKRGKLVHFHC